MPENPSQQCVSDRYFRPFTPQAGSMAASLFMSEDVVCAETVKQLLKAKSWKKFLKDTRCQCLPHLLLFDGLSSRLWMTSVPLGSMVPTHPMAPVSCTGYEYQACSHMAKIWPDSSLCYHLQNIQSTDALIEHSSSN